MYYFCSYYVAHQTQQNIFYVFYFDSKLSCKVLVLVNNIYVSCLWIAVLHFGLIQVPFSCLSVGFLPSKLKKNSQNTIFDTHN